MRALICICLLGLFGTAAALAAPLEGYHDHASLESAMQRMAEHPNAELLEIGRTAEGRAILVLRISGELELLNAMGASMPRPAIAILGNVDAAQLAGREVCLDMAQRLLDSLDDDEELLKVLVQHDFYFLPSPTPDATEFFFSSGVYERSTNSRPADDDNDGRMDEDPGDDLNGDGLITMMRIADPAGEWMEHPDDPRVLIRVKREDNERGQWRLLTEGLDNDNDEQYNEDGPGGVDFNRNMTFNYDQYGLAAGPWQVSEPESRAVVDWLFNNQQFSMILSYGSEDNIRHPWKDDHGRMKFESAEKDDIAVLDYIAKQAVDIIGSENAPDSPHGRGSLADWAYFHYGAWSISTRAWWIPEVKPEEAPAEDTVDNNGDSDATAEVADAVPLEDADAASKEEPRKPSDEKRGRDEVNALRWFEQEGIDGFVDWTPVSHPDFPDRLVEVGGFRPYLRDNPPAAMLQEITTQQFEMLRLLAGLLPEPQFREVEVEDLGEGLFRVTARVANMGYLPTSTRKAQNIRADYPLNIAIELPEGASLLNGALRSRVERIGGNGEWSEHAWLVLAPTGGMVRLVAACPSVGMATASAELGN
jgi:hypothetical protein